MSSPEEDRARQWGATFEAAVAAIGVCFFALFAHSRSAPALLSALGLVLTTIAFYHWNRTERSPFAALALQLASRRAAAITGIGAGLGAALGVVYRQQYGWPLLPDGLAWFALPAAAIGAMEEVLYRGYVQGRARWLGPAGAVLFAAACHTAYKCCLFAVATAPLGVPWHALVLVTFIAGAGFGALRELSGCVWPAVLAHAAFDITVYGAHGQAPWWVWQ